MISLALVPAKRALRQSPENKTERKAKGRSLDLCMCSYTLVDVSHVEGEPAWAELLLAPKSVISGRYLL